MWFLAFVLLCAIVRLFALLKHYFREEEYNVIVPAAHLPFAMCVLVVKAIVLVYVLWLYFYA